ncbi:MAG TPA: ribosome assembly RNA-binding protein YhbY [Spirochaetota bacterium]
MEKKEYTMSELAGWQKQYLRGLAHHLKPLIQVGKLGMTPALVDTIRKALDSHELIKIKFLDFKDEKEHISERIVAATDSHFVGLIGNVLTIYRESSDKNKRKIIVPTEK